MKAVLISIKPKWCSLIKSGRKTMGNKGFYHAKQSEVHINSVFDRFGPDVWDRLKQEVECETQSGNSTLQITVEVPGAGWMAQGEKEKLAMYLEDRYGKSVELSDFIRPCENDLYCEVCAMYREFEDRCGNKALTINRAPQSWCYVEEVQHNV